jgi:hypothetical protein
LGRPAPREGSASAAAPLLLARPPARRRLGPQVSACLLPGETPNQALGCIPLERLACMHSLKQQPMVHWHHEALVSRHPPTPTQHSLHS